MRKLILIVFVFLFSSVLHAQQVDDYIVTSIQIEGNKKTKNQIILRELEFKQGDTIAASNFKKIIVTSQQNIFNKGLFNFADLEIIEDTISNQNTHYRYVTVTINLVERWYFWPIPQFSFAERNFNTWWQNKDFSRLCGGVNFVHYNFLGRLYKLTFTCIGGYNQDYGIAFDMPYINSKTKFGAGASVGFTQNIGMAYGTISDKVQHYTATEGYAHQSIYLQAKVLYHSTLRNTHTLTLRYDGHQFADTLAQLNPDFAYPLNHNSTQYLSLSYIFKNDFRDDRSYPLNGHYLELQLNKTGFNFFEEEPHFNYLKTTFDIYTPINQRWYWASNFTFRVATRQEPSYYLAQGMGYNNDFVRGFEIYAPDGKDFYLLKNNLKLDIFQFDYFNLPFLNDIRFKKSYLAVYLNFFFDAAYVSSTQLSPQSRMQNNLIFGSGLGIDIVTYYDKVFRIEYGINSYGELGFALHFVAPI